MYEPAFKFKYVCPLSPYTPPSPHHLMLEGHSQSLLHGSELLPLCPRLPSRTTLTHLFPLPHDLLLRHEGCSYPLRCVHISKLIIPRSFHSLG